MPPSSRRTRSQAAARRGLWVAMTEVRPRSRCIWRNKCVQAVAGPLRRDRRWARRPARAPAASPARARPPRAAARRRTASTGGDPAARPAPRRRAGPRPPHGASAERPARDAHRHLGVFERRKLRQQVMELEHEADPRVAEAPPAPRRTACARSRPSTTTVPLSGRSSPPSRCSKVLLPTPLAPMIATISPGSTDKVKVAQDVDILGAHAVALVEGGDGDEGHYESPPGRPSQPRWRDGAMARRTTRDPTVGDVAVDNSGPSRHRAIAPS